MVAQTAGIGRFAEGFIMESRGTASYSLCRARGWPPASMTYQQDLEDLAHHEAEIRAHQSFNYGLFDDAETALPGCVYIGSTGEARRRRGDFLAGGRRPSR